MNAGQVPEFELYNMTTRLAIIYKKTLEYSELQLSAECDHLHATNSQNPKIMAEQALAYKSTLDSFAI